jgi:hypothetical protein
MEGIIYMKSAGYGMNQKRTATQGKLDFQSRLLQCGNNFLFHRFKALARQ